VYRVLAASDTQAIDLLNSASYDPRMQAIVPSDEQLPTLSGESRAASPAQIVEARPGRLVLDVTAEADGLLVASQPYYPGWQARVDGSRVPIVTADYLLQGVPVTAGSHRVELTYHNPIWPGVLSVVALLVCAAGLIVLRRH
jgi:uncharacterized membrane protein YfhO